MQGATSALGTQLKHADWWKRLAALEELGEIGHNSSKDTTGHIAAILGRLEDSDTQVRWASVNTLSCIDPDAVLIHSLKILSRLSHREAGVRVAALDVLRQLGPLVAHQADVIVQLLADRDSTMQWTAVETLRTLGQRALPAVTPLLSQSGSSQRRSQSRANLVLAASTVQLST